MQGVAPIVEQVGVVGLLRERPVEAGERLFEALCAQQRCAAIAMERRVVGGKRQRPVKACLRLLAAAKLVESRTAVIECGDMVGACSSTES